MGHRDDPASTCPPQPGRQQPERHRRPEQDFVAARRTRSAASTSRPSRLVGSSIERRSRTTGNGSVGVDLCRSRHRGGVDDDRSAGICSHSDSTNDSIPPRRGGKSLVTTRVRALGISVTVQLLPGQRHPDPIQRRRMAAEPEAQDRVGFEMREVGRGEPLLDGDERVRVLRSGRASARRHGPRSAGSDRSAPARPGSRRLRRGRAATGTIAGSPTEPAPVGLRSSAGRSTRNSATTASAAAIAPSKVPTSTSSVLAWPSSWATISSTSRSVAESSRLS